MARDLNDAVENLLSTSRLARRVANIAGEASGMTFIMGIIQTALARGDSAESAVEEALKKGSERMREIAASSAALGSEMRV